MKHLITCLLAISCLFMFGRVDQTSEQAKKSDEIVMKMRQIDLLNQIIPLVLTKDQINQLLPAIERARAKAALVQKDEASALRKLDGKISEAIKKAIETGVAPPKDLLNELATATTAMTEKRLLAMDENTDAVYKVFSDTCNAGQKKAAANSFSPAFINPGVKPDQLTDVQKIRFFVDNVLLDPQAHDLLVALAKHAS